MKDQQNSEFLNDQKQRENHFTGFANVIKNATNDLSKEIEATKIIRKEQIEGLKDALTKAASDF